MKYAFGWIDCVSMIFMLALTASIGIYYGFFKKQSTQADYLFGGKKMSVLPVSFSLVSSIVSGLPLLTFPTEIYRYGIHYMFSSFSFIVISLLAYHIYLPIFYKLQVTSAYEYLQLRFGNEVRIFASAMYAVYLILYVPVVIYIPGVTVAQVTGISIHYITPIICGTCILYTTLGGLKAVVWTDAVQFVGMIGAMLFVLVLGISLTGGFKNVWNINREGGRLDLDFSMDMTKRDTFWTGSISAFFMWLTFVTTNQSVIQKCLSLSTYKKVKHAMIIFTIGVVVLVFCCYALGFVLYARYYDCDPMASGQVEKKDQMVPNLILDISRAIPGLAGVYICGILSAGLSTLSASLNSLSATVYGDLIAPRLPEGTSEAKISFILKSIVAATGILCTALVYIIERTGSIFPIGYSIVSLMGGPLFSLFTAGMLLPMVNSKGILTGATLSLVIMGWITLASQWYQLKKILVIPELAVRVDGCNITGNATLLNINRNISVENDVFVLYKISHFHYTPMSVILVIAISLIVSFFTRKREDKDVNRDCICPLVHFMLPKKGILKRQFNEQKLSLMKIAEIPLDK